MNLSDSILAFKTVRNDCKLLRPSPLTQGKLAVLALAFVGTASAVTCGPGTDTAPWGGVATDTNTGITTYTLLKLATGATGGAQACDAAFMDTIAYKTTITQATPFTVTAISITDADNATAKTDSSKASGTAISVRGTKDKPGTITYSMSGTNDANNAYTFTIKKEKSATSLAGAIASVAALSYMFF